MVKCEDTELDHDKRDIVEVTEHVVALVDYCLVYNRLEFARTTYLPHHHQIVRLNCNNMSSHTMRWAESQAACAFSNKTHLSRTVR